MTEKREIAILWRLKRICEALDNITILLSERLENINGLLNHNSKEKEADKKQEKNLSDEIDWLTEKDFEKKDS